MRLREWTGAEWLALAAGVLGALVLAGYGFHSTTLVQPGGGAPMEPSTAVSLVLGAMALLGRKRIRTLFAALLLALNLAVLLEIAAGVTLGVDWPLGRGWVHEPAVHIARTSLLSSIGFLLVAAALLLLPHIRRQHAWIEQWLTWLAIADGMVGILGYFLHLDLLYEFRGLVRPALHSGIGILLLALALWMSWRHLRWHRPRPGYEQAARILAAARLTLIAVIVAAGWSGLMIVQRTAERSARDDLLLRLHDRSNYIRLLVLQALARGQAYSEQPDLAARLRGAAGGKPLRLPHDFSGITLERGRRTIAALGTTIDHPEMQVPLPDGLAADLIWNGEFFLRQQLPVFAGNGEAGRVTMEQPLPLLGRIGVGGASFGASGEVGLCGAAIPPNPAMVCFPRRLHPTPFLLAPANRGYAQPVRLALDGKTGVADTIDYRGQRVLAAYGPVDGTGLGMVVKMDSRELYAPVRQEIAILGPILILLAALGLEMLRWQVHPLVEELVASRNQVASSEARFRAAAESGMDPFYIFESVRSRTTGAIANFRLIYANQPGEEFAGIEPGRGAPLGLSSVPQLEAAGEVQAKFRQVVVGRQHWVTEFARPNGTTENGPQWLSLQAAPLGDGVALTLRDISERKWEEERLRVMALTDPLTGLANRDAFQKRLSHAMHNSRQSHHEALHAVLILDVDHFKQINDTYGHGFGDQVLRAFAARLLRSVRSADTVARPGGDEFAILLENLDSTRDAERVINGIYAALADPMHLDHHVVPVATSIGVAYYRGEAMNPDELVQRADAALYEAKRSGRNAWRAFTG